MAKKIVIEEKLEKGDLVLQYFLYSESFNTTSTNTNTNSTEVRPKDTITSLELVDQINLFRREEGKENDLVHKNLLAVIRDEFEDDINGLKIQPVEYKDKKGEARPMFILTLSQAKQVLLRESKFVRKHVIAYIDKLEDAIKNNNISDKDRMLLAIMKSESEEEMAENISKYERNYVKPLERRVDEAEKKVEHQVGVISGLTSKIKLQTQRQFLNEIIRMRGNEDGLISARWNMLYKFYENQKHINLSIRMKAYNQANNAKINSRLEYVDTVMNDLGTLYEVAVKTFESDFKSKLQKYLDAL